MIRKIALGAFVVMWLVAPAVYAAKEAVKEDKTASAVRMRLDLMKKANEQVKAEFDGNVQQIMQLRKRNEELNNTYIKNEGGIEALEQSLQSPPEPEKKN